MHATNSDHPDVPPRATDTPIAAARRRVLVIDDHPDTADSLALLLVLAGHAALPARCALTAFEALRTFDPDACVVDLRMPDMDGFEAACRLRVILGPRVRLIAITGELGAAADPRVAVFERVLTKPIDMAEMLRELEGEPPRR